MDEVSTPRSSKKDNLVKIGKLHLHQGTPLAINSIGKGPEAYTGSFELHRFPQPFAILDPGIISED